MKKKYEIVLDNAINIWGIPSQISIFMEEAGELIQAINKYYNRNSSTKQELASEVADVEICIDQLKRMIGKIKFDNLMLSIKNNDINMTSFELMSNCGKAVYSAHCYFMGDGYFEDEVITDLCNLKMSCMHIRNHIGNEEVDTQKNLKIIRLTNRIEESLNNE